MAEPDIVKDVEGFDWDEGNLNKNRFKHNVEKNECEEAFYGKVYIQPDLKHSTKEKRYYILVQTIAGRYLFISFTIRNNLIRVISARDQNKKERSIYEKI